MSELALYTIPSTWKHPILPRFREFYQRVVGVETVAGLIACRFALQEDVVPDLATFDVPEELAEGVAYFYDRHLAGHDPEVPDSSNRMPYGRTGLLTTGRVRYNCHIFAETMQPDSKPYDGRLHDLKKRAEEYGASATPFEGYLAAGERGVVKHLEYGFVSHSFIGLGENVPLTLQIIDNNGNMGLLPYSVVLGEYGRHRSAQYALVSTAGAKL